MNDELHLLLASRISCLAYSYSLPGILQMALHNACWKDSVLSLELNSAWGLPDGQTWDAYRWYPDPAKMQGEGSGSREKAAIALRPFDVVLLEIVPHGQSPSLNRSFPSKPVPLHFAEATQEIDITSVADAKPPLPTQKPAEPTPKPTNLMSLAMHGQIPATGSGGALVVSVQIRDGSGRFEVRGPGQYLSCRPKLAGQDAACQPVLGKDTYPSCWQAWRIAVEPSAAPRPLEMEMIGSFQAFPTPVELKNCRAYFIPR
jgi:hypothetical protein